MTKTKNKMKKRNNGKHSNISIFPEFENILVKTQVELKAYLHKYLIGSNRKVINRNGYLYSEGTYPILLIAHMDTVHKEVPRFFIYTKNNNKLSSPQGLGGDDRCGIYMILEIIKEIDCSVLFVEDEEIGCVGSMKFVIDYEDKKIKLPTFNYLVEFDRRNANDAVYYDLDNKEFEKFITDSSGGHFKTALGTCSDISEIAPVLEVAAVNLSCGYYKEHTFETYVMISEMKTNIEKAKMILKTAVEKPFEWKSKWAGYKGMSYRDIYNYYGYYGYYDDEDFGYNGNKGTKKTIDEEKYEPYNLIRKSEPSEQDYFYVIFIYDKNIVCNYTWAISEAEAIGLTVVEFPKLQGTDILSVGITDNLYDDDYFTIIEEEYEDGEAVS